VSVDRTKVLEAAQKHLAKGAFDKAIIEFQKLVKADPSDVRTWLKIGDLQTKIGAKNDAISTYARVADQYAQQGFFLKAVAVHKQILKLEPTRLDIQLKLAEMYEQLQLVSDALQTYEMVAGGYARAGDMDKALATLGRMVDLDSENIPTRIKYAEALSRAGKQKDAADAFEAGAKLLKAQGRIDDYLKVAERLLYHRAEDVVLSRELAQLYLERNDGKRALAKLQVCFKADPKDVPTLEMLATAFEQLGQLPKTVSVYREVARIHAEAQRPEERAKTLRRILALDPGDAEARQALAAYAQPVAAAPVRRDLGPPPGAVVEPSHPSARRPADLEENELEDDAEILEADELDEDEIAEAEALEAASISPENEAYLDADGDEPPTTHHASQREPSPPEADPDDEDIIVVDEVSSPPPAPDVPSEPPPMATRTSLPPEIAREAQIAKLLTECEVFLRYGLKQKVVEQLRRVLELEPRHVEAREKLKDVLIDRGELEAAGQELLFLADTFTADKPSVAMLYLRQLLEIDPGNLEAQGRLDALSPAPKVAPTPEPARMVVPPPRAVLPVAAIPKAAGLPTNGKAAAGAAARVAVPPPSRVAAPEDEVFFVEDEGTETGARPALQPSPPTPVPLLAQAEGTPFDDDERTVYGTDPLGDGHAEATESGLDEGQPDGDRLAPISPEEFESAPLRPSAPDVPAPERMSRPSLPPGEVEELLDEAEFFVAQGLYEEARALLRDALTAHPRHPVIGDKLAEIEEAAAHAAASQPPPSLDESFALAERLADDFEAKPGGGEAAGSDVLDVEHVFAAFKKGVSAQVGLEDTDTHFDLGIAYKEMGLLADAIAEFTLCLANPQRICISETMIGLCHIEKGELAEAIIHYKKGLYAETKTDREELGLYYELGRAYETLQDPKEALYYFEKVKKRDPSFRGVQQSIDALTRPPAPVAAAPSAATDDIDAVFDDLMGKD
jgi:pilus assembly protein FimV